ncbi:MAG TPA: hypothetical protein VMF66_17870 [Candidatus Acidoferrum sp.]|nr:hypothetical protein [Candidatus Acidoferrum sp.]
MSCTLLLLFSVPESFARGAKRENSHSFADRSPVIVIGFVGGFVRATDPVFGTVRLANLLRRDYPSGVAIRVFENHREDSARREVLRLLDIDNDGTLSSTEKKTARIVIYGHSWGGSETVQLARQLQRQGIPVLLTVQVDSVRKPGENDAVIPANVEEAANFYQPDGIIRGVSEIHAADPGATDIVGNFRFDYKQHPLSCEDYPWQDRIFMKTHMEIDCDPNVWSKVESLIRSKLPDEAKGS